MKHFNLFLFALFMMGCLSEATLEESLLAEEETEEKKLNSTLVPIMLGCNTRFPDVEAARLAQLSVEQPFEITSSVVSGSELIVAVKYAVSLNDAGKQTFFACPYLPEEYRVPGDISDPRNVAIRITLSDTFSGRKTKTKSTTLRIPLRPLEVNLRATEGSKASGSIDLSVTGSSNPVSQRLNYIVPAATRIETAGVNATHGLFYTSSCDIEHPLKYIETKNTGSSTTITKSKIRSQFGISNDMEIEILSRTAALNSIHDQVSQLSPNSTEGEDWASLESFAKGLGPSLALVLVGPGDGRGRLSRDSDAHLKLVVAIKDGLIIGYKVLDATC